MAMKRNPWVENLFRPLVVGAMLGCIALSLVELVHLVFPSWNGIYLVVGCVLAALEANYSYRLIRARRLWGTTEILRFRAVEIAMFFMLLKCGSYVGDGLATVLADIQTWPRRPFNIIDPETTVVFILALLSWRASTRTAYDLERIGEPPEQHEHYVPPVESLTERFFWGGAVLLVVAGITRIGIAAILDMARPSVPGLVLNVLVYFLLGLVMLGQVHFTRLHQQWRARKIKVAEGLTGRWVRYSLAFVGLAALLAFLLPTGYTMGLLDVVATIMYIFLYIADLLAQILFFILLLLLTSLAVRFGQERPEPTQPSFPHPQLPQQEPGGAAPGWFEILRSLLFWAAALGMVFYVVRSYLRDRPELWQALVSLRPIGVLRAFLIALRRRLSGLVRAARERFPRRLLLWQARRGPSAVPFPLFRLGALRPRERVLYYYLSVLRRAGRQGFHRHRSQTPDEYDAWLGPHLPQAEDEMNLLTRAFVEARYSRHTVDREQEKRVRADWERVKAALRTLKRRNERADRR
jgi:hypothetical protein